jgi:hypothetical protein
MWVRVLDPDRAEQSSAALSPTSPPNPPPNKNGAVPALGSAPPDFSLYFQNTKSQGVNRTFFKLYIPPRIRDLPKNTHERGLDKLLAKSRIVPNPASHSSRVAAKEYSPQPALSLPKGRKPWDPGRTNQPAPEGRKKPTDPTESRKPELQELEPRSYSATINRIKQRRG